MAKTKRGKALKRDGYGRGTCPICKRARVKLAWEIKRDGTKVRICKVCNGRVLKGKVTLN